ncbi:MULTISPECIES: phosphatidylinositol-specific phospholipase C domain-containing protein [unclassified Luteococcus]|uniref:phosphatidylinositol-specific phospholipase C domain-containing protein n=1 Tax=unclassified Luteococcus TaxID=2639923 RepID=UPI00313A87E9
MSLLRGLNDSALAPFPSATPYLAPRRAIPGSQLKPAPVQPQDWMGALDPSLRLDALTIPGTHNSGATRGGRWVACQSRPVRAQLDAGARYLDIRVRHHRGSFRIHHNQFFQRLTLDEVLEACQDFLQAHPTESVLLCLTQEYSRSDAAELARTWARIRSRFRGLLRDSRRVPTLAQARGQVVVVTRSAGFAGLDHRAWQVCDDWRIDTRRVWDERKWPGVTDHLRRARAARGDGRMWSVHASSNGLRLTPADAARRLEPALTTHFDELPVRGQGGEPERNGVVLLDFLSDEQSAQLWRRNL